MWDPEWIRAKAYKYCAGILLTASIRGQDFILNLINIYAPYKNRLAYWERIFQSRILEVKSLLMAGDFNLALGSAECWGNCRSPGNMAGRFRRELLNRDVVDVVPENMCPTWDNSRIGQAYIAKRIDRVIMHVSIYAKMGTPVLSIGSDHISDHRPIFLKWREKVRRLGYPFKFNRVHLTDPSFNDKISNKWKSLHEDEMAPFMPFRIKMDRLRIVTMEWQRLKRRLDKQELENARRELDSLCQSADPNSLSFDQKILIRNLEKKKQQILQRKEATWRLKSRAIWLKEGDRNTSFFHRFANARRERNTIWSIKDDLGNILSSQEEITREAVSFFHSHFKRREVLFEDVMWGIEMVPEMLDDAANEEFIKPISKEELLSAIKSIKKDKSLGPDGWPIEFFSHFFDLIKMDLLRMLEATRMSGSIHPEISSTFIALIPKKIRVETFHNHKNQQEIMNSDLAEED